jgi:hypothetical protein
MKICRLWSSKFLSHVFLQMVTNILEVCTASIFKMELTYTLMMWKQHIPPKCQQPSARLHAITSQKTMIHVFCISLYEKHFFSYFTTQFNTIILKQFESENSVLTKQDKAESHNKVTTYFSLFCIHLHNTTYCQTYTICTFKTTVSIMTTSLSSSA